MVEYVATKIKVCIICPIHGEFWQRPADHLIGYGCSKCARKNKPTTEEWIESAKKVHNNYYDYSKVVYTRASENVIIICPKHGEFKQTPSNHRSGKGCPSCTESKGELRIRNFLTDSKIEFYPQHAFKKCKNKRKLSFDFYIPSKNLLIEYDGIQHYQVGVFGSGEDRYNKQIINDQIKTNFANANGIQLLRIPYYQYDNIDSILSDTFH
jgi:very-short-patch-repair endonuclease